jgi:hypothetical protein
VLGVVCVKMRSGCSAMSSFTDSRQCARGAGRYGDHGDLAANQIGRQRGKPIVLTICPTIFNRNVPTLNVTVFAQALVK